MKKRPLKILLLSIVGVLFLSPFIVPGVILLSIEYENIVDACLYPPTTNFNKTRWASDQKYRYTVMETVNLKIIKMGMTQAQVTAILGKPDSKNEAGGEQNADWQYDAEEPGWRLIDWHSGGLVVEFDAKGRVTQTYLNYYAD